MAPPDSCGGRTRCEGLPQLAFGQVNDGVRLAFAGKTAETQALDLSAVSEIRVTEKGGVEVKFVDRVRALETLCTLLESSGGQGAEELYRALTARAGGGMGARLRYCGFPPSKNGF